MKEYYKIPVWLLGTVTAIILFGTIDEFIMGHNFYGFMGVIAFLGLIYFTFINIKE